MPSSESIDVMPWGHYFVAGATLAVVFTLLWGVLGRAGRSAWADFAWAVAIGVSATILAGFGVGWPPRRIAVAALALIWSARLATHLGRRLSHEGEDSRYRAMAASLGTSYRRFMLGFFLIQAVAAWAFSLPFFALAQVPVEHFTGWEIAGLALWLASLAGTATADLQLAAWKANPDARGRTCRRGLWAWSRHPNYFFEWTLWCAYPLMAIGTAALPWTLAVAGLMIVMIRFVSGVPYTEQQALRSRGDDYRAYQREVPAFVPLPPTFRS